MTRKWICVILVLSLSAVVGAQEKQISQYQYWFDGNRTHEITQSISDTGNDTISFAIDAHELPEGLHTLYLRVQDDEGLWSSLSSWGFFMPQLPKNAEYKVTSCEYWVDNRHDSILTVAIDSGEVAFPIDMSALQEGLHTLNYRTKDNEDMYSALHTWLFFKGAVRDTTVAHRVVAVDYWLDGDVPRRQTVAVDSGSVAFEVDAAKVREGLHTLNYRTRDDVGMYSALNTWLFFKGEVRDTTVAHRVVSVDYWLDDEVARQQTVAMDSSSVAFAVDAAAMSEGLHTLNYRVKDDRGEYSATSTWLFVKNALRDTSLVNRAASVEYWFDNDTATVQRMDVDSDTILFSADASQLREGMHILSMRVSDALEQESAAMSWIFYKSYAVEDTRISWYTYWWEGHYDKAEKVTVESDSSEFVLLQQLEVPDYVKTDGDTCYSKSRLMFVFGNDNGYTSAISITEVSFDLGRYVLAYFVDGEVYVTDSVTYGQRIVPLPEPVKEDRRFSGWRELPETMPAHDVNVEGGFEYRISYVVTDSVLWNIGYFYGDTIIGTPEPEKEWYEFEEWDGLPETMPAKDVTVTGKFTFLLEPGDVNGDDRISVSDITMITNHILRKSNTTFVPDAADLNSDGRISIVDASIATNKILNNED